MTNFLEYYEDQSYVQDERQSYDLMTGESSTLLVLVHGGSWNGGNKRNPNFDNGEIVKYVAQRYGLNVAAVNYTLATAERATAPLDKNTPLPNPAEDVMRAVNIIKQRIGATRVVLLGSSAGANIAGLTYVYYPDLIDGFIGFYGPYDLTKSEDFPQSINDAIDIYTGSDPARKLSASPSKSTNWPDRLVLLYHGDADGLVSKNQSIDLDTKINADLNILQGFDHGFKVFGEKDNPAPWVERMIRYIYTGE